MPLYEYECTACGHRFERIQKFSDPPVGTCPSCGGEVRKLLSSPAIQFKGSGWYITDYARKDAGGQAAAPKTADQSGESKSDSGTSSGSSSSSAGSTDTKPPSSST